MRILHTADWHLGSPRSPYKDGINLRSEDTKRCLDEMVRVARENAPDYVLVSGDIFDVGKLWSDRCCGEIVTAYHYIRELAGIAKQVVVMRGTPNHDGAGQFRVLSEMFSDMCQWKWNVHIVTEPQVLKFDDINIAVLPGFDSGIYSTAFPELSKEDRNTAITQELTNIVIGLKADCDPDKPSVLMAHYTVPGANIESGQVTMLAQFEPFLPREALEAAGYDLVALGHIHRPQKILNCDWYYSGAINLMNFNDEGQERGFWIHQTHPEVKWQSFFYNTPVREFKTIDLEDADVAAVNLGNADEVAERLWRADGAVRDKIVRVRYSCSEENNKAFNRSLFGKMLTDEGAFMVWEVLPDKITEFANRAELQDATDPEENLVRYLEEKEVSTDRIQELVMKARPIISQAQVSVASAAYAGTFEPVEISVKNYRNYVEETFDFSDISFCTINGQNGAGKSSLFMDAIIDCLYEEPREGDITGWIRNDEKARSGSIMFTFRLGEKLFRVTRTRTRSRKGTLNLAECVDDVWEDRSRERYSDTQQEILDIIGMDSLTFKSCALIMQDQYGLFLQAKPEERVKVLGTLLGLDVYRYMEKIAADTAAQYGAQKRALENRIEIHAKTLSELGDPQEELYREEQVLSQLDETIKRKEAERDRNRLQLISRQEAAQRRDKLLSSVQALAEKRRIADRNRCEQQDIVRSSLAVLSEKDEIEEKVAEYNLLIEKEKALAAESALYLAKCGEAEDFMRQAEAEQENINKFRGQLSAEELKKQELEEPVNEAAIRKRAEEYQRADEMVQGMTELRSKYTEALLESESRKYKYLTEERTFRQEIDTLEAKKAEMALKAESLQESGCPHIEDAACWFLSDALEAKKQIPEIERQLFSCTEEHERNLTRLLEGVREAEQAALDIGFDEEQLNKYQHIKESLSGAPGELRAMEEREGKIALISARISHIQSNISDYDKRLSAVKLKASDAAQERDAYAESFSRHADVEKQILLLKPWLEKEKQIPVAEERRATAMRRVMELNDEVLAIDAEIAEKTEEAEKENITSGGIEELSEAVDVLTAEIDMINGDVKKAQMKIGALRQKAGQIAGIEKEVEALIQEKMQASKETADHDLLKAAFSQSGVPHQIIRSIVPKLTATANSILGQMTGGNMGVEFRLERLQKNGKEKTSLDIFIEEGDRTPLPYLSKSGGEKVKSSLSVILALAEIKSSSAGVQLGMLFIDEPPFLDGDGIQAYCDALETIQSRYPEMKVMAITHDPTMKARFPQSLDVVKTDNGSKVVY